MEKFMLLICVALLPLCFATHAGDDVCVPVTAFGESRLTALAGSGWKATKIVTRFPSGASSKIGPFGMVVENDGTLWVNGFCDGKLYRFPADAMTNGPADASAYVVLTFGRHWTINNPTALAQGFHKDELYVGFLDKIMVLDKVSLTWKRQVGGSGLASLPERDWFQDLKVDYSRSTSDKVYLLTTAGAIGIVEFVDTGVSSSAPGTLLYPHPTGNSFDGLVITNSGIIYGAVKGRGAGEFVQGFRGPYAAPYGQTIAVVPYLDGLATSDRCVLPNGVPKEILVNTVGGFVYKVTNNENGPSTVVPIAHGGTRGDLATVGPDGCFYVTQSESVFRISLEDGTCPECFKPIPPTPECQPVFDSTPDAEITVSACDGIPDAPVLTATACGESVEVVCTPGTIQDACYADDYDFEYTCVATSSTGLTATFTQTIHVQADLTAPTVTRAPADFCLWPPNHKYYCFSGLNEISSSSLFGAEDNCGASSLSITFDKCQSSQCDEAPSCRPTLWDNGDGNTVNDCFFKEETGELCVRAERAGVVSRERKPTRWYQGVFTVADECGNSREAKLGVFVPHDESEHHDCLVANRDRNGN